MGSKEIKKDLQDFQGAVKNLGDKIGEASALWNDSKYAELRAAVGRLATQSREMMVNGERYCRTLDKFSKIAAEKY